MSSIPTLGEPESGCVSPPGFVRLSQFLPGVLLEMAYHGSDNFMGCPVEGYDSAEAFLSLPAAKALQGVQQTLEAFGLGLKLFDAYRPQRAVQHFLRWEHEPEQPALAARFHPGMSKSELFAQGYIATRSSHSRGSTVDLTVVERSAGLSHELDMGTEFDFFGPASAPTYPHLTVAQRANRLLLRTVMEQHGFRGFALEWWHFSLYPEPYPQQYFDFPIR